MSGTIERTDIEVIKAFQVVLECFDPISTAVPILSFRSIDTKGDDLLKKSSNKRKRISKNNEGDVSDDGEIAEQTAADLWYIIVAQNCSKLSAQISKGFIITGFLVYSLRIATAHTIKQQE